MSHRKLLHKIHHYGIRGKTKSWITAFLDFRQQQVVVNGRASNTADVLSGVPQGTVLGPMLFLLYICNELGGNMARSTQFPIMITRSTIIYEIVSPGAAGNSIYI